MNGGIAAPAPFDSTVGSPADASLRCFLHLADESLAQFKELYPQAFARGRIVMGGTCDSVGMAGCLLAGCYGPFTKLFGNAAVNLVEARFF